MIPQKGHIVVKPSSQVPFTYMHQLLLGVKLLGAAFPVAICLIDDFRLLLAFIFVPFLFHQGGSFWLFLKGRRIRQNGNKRVEKLDLGFFSS